MMGWESEPPMDPAHLLANPFLAVVLRVVLGSYVIYMARRFYADPLGYFRRSLRSLPDAPWFPQLVRVLAGFCLWGGCFIVAAAIAVQIFRLHGNTLLVVLIFLTLFATWLLLPSGPAASQP